MKSNRIYPFSAIVGQEQMKLALVLNAIHPRIGGVLVRGEKGTAKSTAVRALAALLPEIAVLEGCAYSCHPDKPEEWCGACRNGASRRVVSRKIRVVDFPLNATEDRVTGGMDFQLAVKNGRPAFQPGLLAHAHRGFLYVDEVNLLDDHLVDIILDASASGENIVEREGISFRHAARFMPVGTMNPEEGELRPQLLDRFGLCVEVAGIEDVAERALLMQRRERFDTDPEGFAREFEPVDRQLAAAIVAARELLPRVTVDESIRKFIADLCTEKNVAGHRADLIIERTAAALAALDGRREVTIEDAVKASDLALLHRIRHVAPQPPPPAEEKQSDRAPHDEEPARDEADENDNPQDHQQDEPPPTGTGEAPAERDEERSPDPDESAPEAPAPRSVQERIFEIGETFRVRRITREKDRVLRRGSGRRSRTRTSQKQGRYVRSSLDRQRHDLALDATLRAAAPYQKRRSGRSGLAVVIERHDLREKVREKRIGNFFLFIVDASGSMGAQGRMSATKGAVMSLLLDAYQKRDRVALISFRGREAALLVPPTSSIDLAGKLLKDLPVGGRTPLSAGLIKGYEVLRSHFLKDPSAQPIVLVITDGKSNVALNEGNAPLPEALFAAGRMAADPRGKFVVVDTEQNGLIRFGLASRVATALNAEYFQIDNLKAENLLRITRSTN